MDSKKILEKLVKIAENQQKMIMKLAQGVGAGAGVAGETGAAQPMGGGTDSWDVSAQVSGVLAQIPEAAKTKAGIQSASLGAGGFLDVKVKFPSVASMSDPTASAALNQLRTTLKSVSLKDPNGKPVAVTRSNVVGVYG